MKPPDAKNSIYRVQALDRALDILDCFNFQNRQLSLSDVVYRTGLNKTTAKRLISNLTTRGYLQQDPKPENISSVCGFLNWAASYLRRFPCAEQPPTL